MVSFTNLIEKLRLKLTPPPLALTNLTLTSVIIANATAVAARLKVADALKDGPKSSFELAQVVEADAPSLYRLMRVLASVGVFGQTKDGRFKLTAISKYLLSDASPSLAGQVSSLIEDWHHQLWGELYNSVKSGQPAYERVLGMEVFQFLEQNPAKGEFFNRVMIEYSAQTIAATATSYDFSQFHRLVDVGGGYGQLLSHLLQKYPLLKGVLFDLPYVLTEAGHKLELAGVADRCELVGGSFFEAVPGGGDGYILLNILHDWGDEQAIEILKSCRQAIGPSQAKLLVVELVIPDKNKAYFGTLMDLEMYVLFHRGRERSQAEYAVLLQAAGFSLRRLIPTPSPAYIMEAVPA
jgi:hypothetical protein